MGQPKYKLYDVPQVPFIHGSREKIEIGHNVSLNNALFNTRSGIIKIGNSVIFGHNVMVLTGEHDRGGGTKGSGNDIFIEDRAWIASGVIVTGGVTIGEGSVVGAGSVVTRDVPPNVFAAGNPARVIKGV